MNDYEINLSKYNSSEKNQIKCLLSSLDDISLRNFDLNIKELVEKRSKGWSNFLRKGISKIHRHRVPYLIGWNKLFGTQKQPLLRMYHRFKKHDHQRNELLIQYREKKGLRLNIRTERHEMYKAFDLALLNHLDVDKFGIGLFEITCSVEMLAKTIKIYRIDNNGHSRYDTLLNAIIDYEVSKQIIIYREFDKEKKVYKPVRMWLTIEFFKSRGFTEDELRNLLSLREHYLHKKNIFNQARDNYQKNFLQRLDKAGVLNPPAKLVKKLIRIKNKLVDMHYETETIKRAKKEKKQAEAATRKKESNAVNYYAIFENFIQIKNIATSHKFVIIKEVLQETKHNQSEQIFWYHCLLKVGWSADG